MVDCIPGHRGMSEVKTDGWQVVQSRYARGKTEQVESHLGAARKPKAKIMTKDGSFHSRHSHFRTREGDVQTKLEEKTKQNGYDKQEDVLKSSQLPNKHDDALQEKDDILDKVGLPFRTREGFTSQVVTSAPGGRRSDRKDDVRRSGRGVNDSTSLKMERFTEDKIQLQRGILRLGPGVKLSRSEGGGEQSGSKEPNFSLQNDEDWPSVAGHGQAEGRRGTEEKAWTAVVKTQPPMQPPSLVKGLGRKIRNRKLGFKDPILHTHILHSYHTCKQQKPSKPPPSDGEGREGVTPKKTKKKKKGGGGQGAEEQHQAMPLTLELGSVLENLEVQKSRSSKLVFSTGSGLSVLTKSKSDPIKPPRKLDGKEANPRNILDASAPSVRRGKEREAPKKKKPTSLRKVISKEKEEKKRLREQGMPIPMNFDVVKEPGSDAENEEHSTPKTTPTIHNRKFREYCTHIVSEEMDSCVETLLSELVRFQDRQFLRDPTKAKAKRRYVCGLREVMKHLSLRRLKCVILPPNLDRIQSTGGINEMVDKIADQCSEQGVPMVFALSRRRMAYVLKKKHNIGCVGIFSYDGAEAHYKKLMQLVEEASEEYKSRMLALKQHSPPVKPAGEEVTAADIMPLGDGDIDKGLSQGSADTYFSLKSETGFTDEEELEYQNGTQMVEPEHGNETHNTVALHPGNLTAESKSGNLMKTPWNIFFKSDSSANSAAAHLGNHDDEGSSSRQQGKVDLLVHDLEDTAADPPPVQPLLTVVCPSSLSPSSEEPEMKLNVHATEFVPSFKFELNINATEFTPATQM